MSRQFLPCKLPDSDSELLLVEGLSALYAVEQVRNRSSQALLAMQGKVPNAATRPARSIERHAQCRQLFAALGCGSGKNCDIDSLAYGSVTILSDPDVDGAHSRYLLLVLFQHFLQPVIQAQRLKLVICPRYRFDPAGNRAGASPVSIEDIDSNSHYFWSDDEKQRFLDGQATSHTGQLTVFKGLGSLASHELSRWVVARETRHELDLYNQHQPATR